MGEDEEAGAILKVCQALGIFYFWQFLQEATPSHRDNYSVLPVGVECGLLSCFGS